MSTPDLTTEYLGFTLRLCFNLDNLPVGNSLNSTLGFTAPGAQPFRLGQTFSRHAVKSLLRDLVGQIGSKIESWAIQVHGPDQTRRGSRTQNLRLDPEPGL